MSVFFTELVVYIYIYKNIYKTRNKTIQKRAGFVSLIFGRGPSSGVLLPQPTCSITLPTRRGQLATVFLWLRASSLLGSEPEFPMPLISAKSVVKASATMLCLFPCQPERGHWLKSFCGSELLTGLTQTLVGRSAASVSATP